MNYPLVSIIVPFYNEEKYIKNSVLSIIDQTYKNLEILLINDASTDKSLQVIEEIKDSRIRIINCKKNIGRPAARNLGIDEARGEFITMMDADDECDKTRIEKQIKLILENGTNTICGTSIVIKTPSKEIKKILPGDHTEIIKGFNRKTNRVTFVAGTIMCRTDILRQFKYREQFKYFEDWDLLLRLYESKEVKFCNVTEPLYTYMVRTKSTRYESDWYDYNIFARDCQRRRRTGLNEYRTLDNFKYSLKRNLKSMLYYKILKLLIKVKRNIEKY